MAQYRRGRVSVTNGSTTVTGTETGFSGNVDPGDLFVLLEGKVVYEVSSVIDDITIELNRSFQEDTQSNVSYAITRDFTPLFSFPYPAKGDVATAAILRRSIKRIEEVISQSNASNITNFTNGFVVTENTTTNELDVSLDASSNLSIDHSNVSISTGVGLTGGGDITSSRIIKLDIGAINPITSSRNDKVALADLSNGDTIGQDTIRDILSLTESTDVSVDDSGFSFTASDVQTALSKLESGEAAGQVRNAGNTPSIQADTAANRPAAGTAGRIYIETDTQEIFRDNGTSWVSIATSTLENTWIAKSSAYTASNGDKILADTSGGAFTITMPSNPQLGNEVYFTDSTGNWGNNNLTVDGNGNNILDTSTFSANVSNWPFSLVFNGTKWVFGSRN